MAVGGGEPTDDGEGTAARVAQQSQGKDEIDRLIDEKVALEKQRRWKEAIALSEKIIAQAPPSRIDKWVWRVKIGEFYLYDLQPEAAIKEFKNVIRNAPRSERCRAAEGLARAYAELGNFKKARTWLRWASKRYWTGCGNCDEFLRMHAYSIQEVWQKALLPHEEAAKELKRIADGDFTPMKVWLRSQKEANEFQRQRAATEAALILGEMLLRQGDKDQARALLEKVVKDGKG